MNRISRPLLYTLAALAVLVLIAAIIASGHGSMGGHGSLMLFDEDLSGSVLGWLIAIPVLAFVALVVVAVCAAAVLVALLATAFAAVLALLGVAIGLLPVALFLAIPVLAIYGLVKLFQREAPRAPLAA